MGKTDVAIFRYCQIAGNKLGPAGRSCLWLPASLLEPDRQPALADALFAASRLWEVTLHFNKGLAGAPAQERTAARETAMNPAVADAFALAIIAGQGPPAFPRDVGKCMENRNGTRLLGFIAVDRQVANPRLIRSSRRKGSPVFVR